MFGKAIENISMKMVQIHLQQFFVSIGTKIVFMKIEYLRFLVNSERIY